MSSQPDSAPLARSSLARSTLIKMGVRIAVIIALATLFSYLHIFHSLRTEFLLRMERNVSERSEREQAIFVLAEDNQALLKTALAERVQALRQEDPSARFDSLFVQFPDGAIRNRPEVFDGTRMPGVFVPKGVVADLELRRWLLAAYDVLVQYGPAFHLRFSNTYITLPGGAIAIYWPESPTWCQDAEPGFVSSEFEFFTISTPESNPQRRTVWTAVFTDPVANASMVSVSTPVDQEGRHAATISHDILIKELQERTVNEHLRGAYNLLVRDDGQLIVHPKLSLEGATEGYNILSAAREPESPSARLGTPELRAHLLNLFERVKNRAPDELFVEIPEHGEYAAAARLKGPGWTLITVLPKQVVSAAAMRSARYVLAFGLLSLLLELFIMYWVLKQQITRPLLDFNQATARLEAGDFEVGLNTTRGDELGQLAHAFQRMAHKVQQREEALREANEGLEHRVEERTRELQEVHRRFVETARLVGRAEIATNVLHNVGNVLTSVHTSAQLAKERLGRLRLESVERLANLLEEHQDDLAVFLREDERGRNALPFLSRLGKYMREERQQLHSLLGDISRHTEHIGAIVKLQQRYARTPEQLFEPVHLGELVEDALRINQAGLSRHHVKVERKLADVPPIVTEKHKVLMILVNLISNAKYAMDNVPEDERVVTVSLECRADGRIHLEVRDKGVGIAPELLTRIFQHGYTTRQEGNGFGLHSSALAAQELGGALRVHSRGSGQGATFTLELPPEPEQQEERASA